MSESVSRKTGTTLGVDVGGTFTDLIALDPTEGLKLAKVPSTLENQANGVLNALHDAQIPPVAVDLIVHGTTTTTNAVLERKLARTGLITTQGFRDILELGRRTRPQAYGMFGTFEPLIPRDLRLEVPQRHDAEGNELVPLDLDAVRTAGQTLLSMGCEAVVVHFLHAYANPSHEEAAADCLRAFWPNEYITAGHMLLSENREYERGVTAAVNAAVQPVLDKYISRLRNALAEKDHQGSLLVMNGNGGMVSAKNVVKESAKTVMSGPASGVMAAAFTGRMASVPNLITYDMGGTSTDVALIRDATPAVSNEIEIEYGMPIHVPLVDVRTVGAGGGSIARINAGGLLEIGPDSAGALPGPICYGKGGTEPTISDANMLLGRLEPSGLATITGTEAQTVEDAFQTQLGDPLGCDAIQAAAAVVQVANAKMAGAIRMVSLSLGADPRDFALFAFGGAGPLHAAALARELDIPRVLVPARPGLTNALGCLVADLRRDYVQTINKPLSKLTESTLQNIFETQVNQGRAAILKENITLQNLEINYSLDMQFVGQTHLLRVAVPRPDVSISELQSLFEEKYFDRFHVSLDNIVAAVVNVNCSVIGQRPPTDLRQLLPAADQTNTLTKAKTGSRPVFLDNSWRQTPVYQRDLLPEALSLSGPAIIEQMDCTIVIPPHDRVERDSLGNLMIHIGDAE